MGLGKGVWLVGRARPDVIEDRSAAVFGEVGAFLAFTARGGQTQEDGADSELELCLPRRRFGNTR
jgi:hypothetical protein